MKKIKSFVSTRPVAIALSISFFFMQCTEEDLITPEKPAEPVAEWQASTEEIVSSFTISAINTIMVEDVDCSTCTYVVPAHMQVVDGNDLEVKPGSVICLDKARQYGAMEFVNLEGTSENPITIGYCTQ